METSVQCITSKLATGATLGLKSTARPRCQYLDTPVWGPDPPGMADYVLVHGGWAGAWCWEAVAPRLAQAGGRVFAPTLTGLAERADEAVAGVNMTTHIEDVVRVMDEHDLREVMLVGHSYGGMAITGAAHRRPERVAHLFYLDAFVPADGQSGADILGPGFVASAMAAMERAGTEHTIPWLFTIEDILGTGELAERVAARMTPHPVGALFEPVRAAGVSARRTYVFCGGMPRLGLTDAFAAMARDSPDWGYAELPCPHDAPACHARRRGRTAGIARLLVSCTSRGRFETGKSASAVTKPGRPARRGSRPGLLLEFYTSRWLERPTAPGTCDGERDAGALDVGEQPIPILRFERRSGPFSGRIVAGLDRGPAGHAVGDNDVVGGEREDLAVGGQAVQELHPAAVLAQHQPAARAHRDVVGIAQHVLAG
jgi:pimeloyl-ACP methyl ester carboxylesterase